MALGVCRRSILPRNGFSEQNVFESSSGFCLREFHCQLNLRSFLSYIIIRIASTSICTTTEQFYTEKSAHVQSIPIKITLRWSEMVDVA